MASVLLSSRVASLSDVEFAADINFPILYFTEKHMFGVFLVCMTALCVIMMAGELTAQKPVFIALPLNGACEMLGSRENATSKF